MHLFLYIYIYIYFHIASHHIVVILIVGFFWDILKKKTEREIEGDGDGRTEEAAGGSSPELRIKNRGGDEAERGGAGNGEEQKQGASRFDGGGRTGGEAVGEKGRGERGRRFRAEPKAEASRGGGEGGGGVVLRRGVDGGGRVQDVRVGEGDERGVPSVQTPVLLQVM
ncbi:hypothetical protein DM860_013363 [Cuscuta australis]|uniref:Uncharacterized protein n=1 Tax=Cuscuta australis TaxID=267555 RepID=A0A328DRX4_9ASTE|nr:hypothetical protein DM860_013363 [Cuscuta australis]